MLFRSHKGFKLEGKKVYQRGVGYSEELVKKYLSDNNLSINDFDWLIPHQANGRMIEKFPEILGVSREKILTNYENFGNTAGASIPLCLSQKMYEGIVKKGDRVLMFSFGAGYSLELLDTYV